MRAPVGGLFRHVCDLAEGQAAQGHAVGIVADSASGGEAARRRFASLIPLMKLGVNRFPISRLPGTGDLAAARRIAYLAREQGAEVLHGHGAKGGAHARLAPLFMRTRPPLRAYTPHGGSLHYERTTPAGFVFLGLEAALLRRTDLLIFESAYGRDAYQAKIGTPSCPVVVIHNGLAPAEFSAVAPQSDAADFVFIGELRHLKGVDVLLNALHELGRGTAVIVGAGSERGELEELAVRLSLTGRVSFAGPLPAREALSKGRCLVVPSRAESLPYVVLEGIAAGLPVIATQVGGIAEIFGDEAGSLVPPGDVAALAGAMALMLDDPDGSGRRAAQLSERISRRFSVETMVEDVLAAYTGALSPRSA